MKTGMQLMRMMKKPISIIFCAIICSVGCVCTNSCGQSGEQSGTGTIKTDSNFTSVFNKPTDSVLLLKHLDSLPKITFPFLSQFNNRDLPTILDLSEFKDKKLFHLPFRRIERSTATGSIDYQSGDSTFNLTDSNYRANWNLIARKPKFIVLEVFDNYAFLVTLSYELNLIGAIRSAYADPSGNVHWHANRNSIIYEDLTVLLRHESYLQIDENGEYETETNEEKWYIDSLGYIQQK